VMDRSDADADEHCCSRRSSSFCSRARAEGKAGQEPGGEMPLLVAFSARSSIPPCSGRSAHTPCPHDGLQPRQYYESALQMLEAMSSESTIGRLARFWQKPEHVVLVGQKVELPSCSMQGGMSAFAHCGLVVHVRPRPQQKRSRWLQLDWFSEGLLCRRTHEEPAIKDELFRREVELDVPLSLLVAVLREIEHHSYGLLFWNCHHFAEYVWTGLQQPASERRDATPSATTDPRRISLSDLD